MSNAYHLCYIAGLGLGLGSGQVTVSSQKGLNHIADEKIAPGPSTPRNVCVQYNSAYTVHTY